jgi:hypothetical protein
MIFDYVAKDNRSLLDSCNVSHFSAINILLVADQLKMNQLEEKLLRNVIIQRLNRDNVLLMIHLSL